jgi:hypothetical protein
LKIGTRTYEFQVQRREKWVQNPKAADLSFNGALHDLLDQDTDYIGLQALKAEDDKINNNSFKNYFDKLYDDLCNYVHFGGLGLIDRFPLDFSKFNEDKLNKWMCNFRRVIMIIGILLAIKFPEVVKEYEKAEATLFQYRSQLITPKQLAVIDAELKKL